MTRARWLTGGLIGAGALIVALKALVSYVSGGLVVGVVAVAALIAVLALGLTSLWRARQYIARELASLGAQPPAGELFVARRQRMVELRGRGVAPDLDVLADATAADEAERAFTGKYLVATTVLIGLVGTFGGLMETLARVSPLLKGELLAGGAGALGLVAGPLAGLHVTFGTSVVAIMVTLALALVQGDVTVHHERLLALLQERTRHVLVPELWPAEESAQERTVRALLDMRASITDTIAAGADANAAKLSAAVRAEVQRLVEQVGADLREASRGQTAALEAASASAAAGLKQTMEAASKAVRESAAANGETLRTELAALAELQRANLAQAVATTTEHARATHAQNAELMTRAVGGLDTAAAALGQAADRASASFSDAAATAVGALAQATERSSASFNDTAATAVGALAQATERTSAAFSESTTAAVGKLVAATERSSASFNDTAATAAGALAQAAERTSAAFSESATAAVGALADVSARTSASFAESTATAVGALGEVSARASASFTESTAAAVGALAELRGTVGDALGGATQALSAAAGELDGTVRALAPALAELTPQLGALATEVALLAARADAPEQPNAVLDELVRLGEDVERLVAASLPPPAPAAEDASA